MSSFLEYPVLGGEAGGCAARAYHPDHGITTFQPCAVSAGSCSGEDRFLAGRGVPVSPHRHHHHGPAQPAAYQHHGGLGVSYAHPGCAPSYSAQGFGAAYGPYPLGQDAELGGAFPPCAPAVYSGSISSSAPPQHPLPHQGYAGAPAQYVPAPYGQEQQSLPLGTYNHALSPLHAAHRENARSPSAETSPPAQTFDWMKVKRNPPKTGQWPAGGPRRGPLRCLSAAGAGKGARCPAGSWAGRAARTSGSSRSCLPAELKASAAYSSLISHSPFSSSPVVIFLVIHKPLIKFALTLEADSGLAPRTPSLTLPGFPSYPKKFLLPIA